MYKIRIFLIFFILQYGFSNALPKFTSDRMAIDVATPSVDEPNSLLEIQTVTEESDDEVRAIYTPMSEHKASDDAPPTKHHRWHFGCRSENTDRSTRSLENFDGVENDIELEVRQGPQGQTQQQPMPTQQQQMPMLPQTTMPLQPQQLPQMQGQPAQGQMPNPQMQGQPPQVQMQNPQMQIQPQPVNMQPMMGGSVPMHPPDGQFHGQYPQSQMPITGTMGQPAMGYPGQPAMGYPGQPAVSYPAQVGMGYPAQPPLNYQTGGWPANSGNGAQPVNPVPPYNGYPPTGQMQLPIPQNQFTGFGPASAYTNPVYNTPLTSNQNDLEAQIATAFLYTQFGNMMKDPTTREAMLYFITELRSFLSNPNAVPLMKALNHRAQDIMNSPGSYGQHLPQGPPHSTSTIVQVQDGANHLMDKFKAKGSTIMSFAKNIANANSRMLEDTTADIPVVNSVVKIGTGLANAGVGFLDGFLSPWLQPSGHGGGTTITTVSTPQAGYPTTQYPTSQYQTPTSITVG